MLLENEKPSDSVAHQIQKLIRPRPYGVTVSLENGKSSDSVARTASRVTVSLENDNSSNSIAHQAQKFNMVVWGSSRKDYDKFLTMLNDRISIACSKLLIMNSDSHLRCSRESLNCSFE